MKLLKTKCIMSLLLIAFMALANNLILKNIINQQHDAIDYLNKSGKQRMLSQRAALIANELFIAKEIEHKNLKRRLHVTIKEMKNAHESLISEAKMSDSLKEMYFQKPYDLNLKMNIYLKHLMQIYNFSAQDFIPSSVVLYEIDHIDAEEILPVLQKIAKQSAKEASDHVVFLVKVENAVLVIILLMIIAIWISVFAPMINKINLYTKQLKEEKRKAEESTELKSEFLANMSHEIRTPMNGIIGMANLLQESSLTKEQKNYLDVVSTSAEHLLELINDILDFSKIEYGKMELEKIEFNFNDLLQGVINLLIVKAKEKNIEILLNIYPDVPEYMIGDSGRIRQIFINLISNALKFTEQGHILINLEINKDSGNIYAYVEDTGIGIPDNKKDHVFNKFNQGDGSTTRNFGGTGLGLAICKELVAMMEGEIGIESTVGVGSKFWFTLFLEEAPKGAKRSKTIDISTYDKPGNDELLLDGCQILLVEDNITNKMVATAMIQKYGALVTPAANGLEAVNMVKQQTFDLIFMDCQMPVMDGFEATRLIKKINKEENPYSTPIIAFTANAMEGDKRKCLESGMDDYISKPVIKEDLVNILLKWLTPK